MRQIHIIIIATFLSLNSQAQEKQFIFSYLGEKNGLSDNIVNCFLRDSRGILWVGTYNGFSRFDGSNFYSYKKKKGPNSMINEVTHSLAEDKNGNIWGGTDKGIFCYKPNENKFDNYNVKSHETGTSFFNVLCDINGNIWATGVWSVFKYNKEKKRFDEVVKLTTNKDSLNFFMIRKNGLLQDPSGKGLWFAARAGLYYYDIVKNKLLNHTNQPNDSLFTGRKVSALSKSPSGNFWFFDDDLRELVCFDPVSKKIVKRISIGTILPNARGATSFEDKNNLLWFSSWTYEILAVDLATGKMQQLKKNEADDRSIAANFFWAAFQDSDGTNWFGTVAGISRCNTQKSLYRSFRLVDKIPQLKETSILVAEEDPADKSIWLVTNSFLLVHYFPSNSSFKVFDLSKAEPGIDGAKPGTCRAIRFIKDQVVITTFTGAWQLKRGHYKISPFRFLPPGYETFKCIELALGGDSAIYYSDGKKLLYWNHVSCETKLIQYVEPQSNAGKELPLLNLSLSSNSKPWFVSNAGRIIDANSTDKLVPVKIIKDENRELGVFTGMDIDAEGKLWIDNKSVGLYCYNPATKQIKMWDETDGLVSSRIHKVKVDNRGRVWCPFYSKVSVFIPGPDRFYNFQIPYSENKLDYINHISGLSSGSIICSINNELFEFFPDRVETIPGKVKPQISMVSGSGNDYQVTDVNKLTLEYGENTVRFRFGLLTDKEIFPYEVEYMLEAAEKKWTKVTGNNEALYNNLAPGSYTFKVKAKGVNNAWETEESFFHITIRAPFYKTKWFLILMILSGFIVLFLIYRYRLVQKDKMMQLERKAQLLEKEKVMVMYESLKQQLNPHFLFNSLTSLSGLIETDQQVAGDFLEQMSGIYRYILKNGDNETVSLKDEIEFVQLYINLQQTRFKKGLKVNVDVPDEYLHFKIPPVTLQNLIENAIKHNIIDVASPLVIDIFLEGDYLAVKNNLQKKNVVETSNKKGLVQFISLYRYLSDLPVVIEETEKVFLIKIPLI